MGKQQRSLEAIRHIAAEAIRLSEEILERLSKGEVLGASPPAPRPEQKAGVGGIVGQGKTIEEAKRDKDYKKVCLIMLVFARDLFKSLLHLERSGSVVPANVLARSLFEAATNLLYIQTDPPNLSERFLTYERAEPYAYLLLCKKWGEPVDPDLEKQIKQRWQSVKGIHGTKKDPTKPNDNWHGRTFRQIFERVAANYEPLQKDRDAYYRPDSALAHASVAALRRYVQRGPDGSLVLCPDGRGGPGYDLLWRSTQHFLMMFAAAEDVLSLGVGLRLQALQKRLKSVVSAAPSDP